MKQEKLEMVKKFEELYNTGMSFTKIGIMFSCSYETVRRHIYQYERLKKLIDENLYDICIDFDIPYEKINKCIKCLSYSPYLYYDRKIDWMRVAEYSDKMLLGLPNLGEKSLKTIKSILNAKGYVRGGSK